MNTEIRHSKYNYAMAYRLYTCASGTLKYLMDSVHTVGNKHCHDFLLSLHRLPPLPTQMQAHEAKVHLGGAKLLRKQYLTFGATNSRFCRFSLTSTKSENTCFYGAFLPLALEHCWCTAWWVEMYTHDQNSAYLGPNLALRAHCGRTAGALRGHCGHMYQRPPKGEGGRKRQACGCNNTT